MSGLSDHAEYDGNVIRVDLSEIECDTLAIPATPNDELRELADQWREQWGIYGTPAFATCADELSELIGDE